MQEEKTCCGCGEELEDEWWYSNMDERVGHKYCVEQYDEQKQRAPAYNVPKRHELINKAQTVVHELEHDLKVVSSSLSKTLLTKELYKQQELLQIALTESYAVDIEKRWVHFHRHSSLWEKIQPPINKKAVGIPTAFYVCLGNAERFS